jgi:hypothetical protein
MKSSSRNIIEYLDKAIEHMKKIRVYDKKKFSTNKQQQRRNSV